MEKFTPKEDQIQKSRENYTKETQKSIGEKQSLFKKIKGVFGKENSPSEMVVGKMMEDAKEEDREKMEEIMQEAKKEDDEKTTILESRVKDAKEARAMADEGHRWESSLARRRKLRQIEQEAIDMVRQLFNEKEEAIKKCKAEEEKRKEPEEKLLQQIKGNKAWLDLSAKQQNEAYKIEENIRKIEEEYQERRREAEGQFLSRVDEVKKDAERKNIEFIKSVKPNISEGDLSIEAGFYLPNSSNSRSFQKFLDEEVERNKKMLAGENKSFEEVHHEENIAQAIYRHPEIKMLDGSEVKVDVVKIILNVAPFIDGFLSKYNEIKSELDELANKFPEEGNRQGKKYKQESQSEFVDIFKRRIIPWGENIHRSVFKVEGDPKEIGILGKMTGLYKGLCDSLMQGWGFYREGDDWFIDFDYKRVAGVLDEMKDGAENFKNEVEKNLEPILEEIRKIEKKKGQD